MNFTGAVVQVCLAITTDYQFMYAYSYTICIGSTSITIILNWHYSLSNYYPTNHK